MLDVIVVGGSFAGLSAALYLASGNHRVLVLDTGAPRNRFSPASHGALAGVSASRSLIFDAAVRGAAR